MQERHLDHSVILKPEDNENLFIGSTCWLEFELVLSERVLLIEPSLLPRMVIFIPSGTEYSYQTAYFCYYYQQ